MRMNWRQRPGDTQRRPAAADAGTAESGRRSGSASNSSIDLGHAPRVLAPVEALRLRRSRPSGGSASDRGSPHAPRAGAAPWPLHASIVADRAIVGGRRRRPRAAPAGRSPRPACRRPSPRPPAGRILRVPTAAAPARRAGRRPPARGDRRTAARRRDPTDSSLAISRSLAGGERAAHPDEPQDADAVRRERREHSSSTSIRLRGSCCRRAAARGGPGRLHRAAPRPRDRPPASGQGLHVGCTPCGHDDHAGRRHHGRTTPARLRVATLPHTTFRAATSPRAAAAPSAPTDDRPAAVPGSTP